MKSIIQILITLIILNSCKKENPISGTYVSQSEMFPKHNGCCATTDLIRLNDDNTFNIYHQDDQGDYVTEDFVAGKYQMGQDIITLKADSMSENSGLSKIRFKGEGSNHHINQLIRQDNKEKYQKIDFQKVDSVNIRRVHHDNWESEEITVRKDGTVRHVLHSFDKTQKPINIIKNQKLTPEQFQHYQETLSKSNIFQYEMTSEKEGVSLTMSIREQNIMIHDENNIDKKLYHFFFGKVWGWMK